MTQSKFYYDDPLAAAYMAREFGVEFDGDIAEDIKHADFVTKTLNHMHGSEFCTIQPIMYIHPDSLAVFEPREGDLVVIGENSLWVVDNDDFWRKYKDHDCIKYNFTVVDRAMDFYYDKSCKIIYRDNKPFFMPKGGEDE